MATPDVPVDLKADITEDVPVDVSINTSVEPEGVLTRNQNLVEASVIKAAMDGSDEVQAFNDLEKATRGRHSKVTLREQSDRQFIGEGEDIKEATLQGFDNDAERSLERIEAAQILLDEEKIRADASDGPALALVRSLALPLTAEDDLEREAVRIALGQKLQALQDDISIGDTVAEIALEFIPFKFLVDNFQVTGTINPFAAQRAMEQMIIKYKRLTPEEQLRAFPILKEELFDALPEGRAVAILTLMTDPTIDEESALSEFGLLSALDIVFTAVELFGIAKLLSHRRNIVRLAKELGNPEKATDVNLAVLADDTGQIGRRVDVDPITAVDNSMPFDVPENDRIAAGLAGDMQTRLQQFTEQMRNTARNLEGDRFFLREGILDDNDRERRISAIVEQFDDMVKHEMETNGRIITVKRSPQIDSKGVRFEFDAEIPLADGGGVVKESGTFNRTFNLDDVGHWEFKDAGFLPDWIKSPKLKAANSDLTGVTDGAIRLDFADQVVATQLRLLMKQANESIRKTPGNTKLRVREVDRVLISGDDAGRLWTPSDLRAGVNGVKLDEGQIEAYYKIRELYDGLGDILDAETRSGMVTRGIKTIRLRQASADASDVDKNLSLGGVKETAAEAKLLLDNNKDITKVYDAANNIVRRTSDLDLEGAYANGLRLVRLEDTRSFAKKGIFQTVLVRVDDITELPHRVLKRNVGYVPRANPQATWFVQAFRPVVIDGVVRSQRRVERGFDTQAQAREFQKRLQFEADDLGQRVDYAIAQDREIEKLRSGDSGLNSSGGLIYGPRRGEQVPFGLPEEELEGVRRNAMESLQIYAENVKNFVTRNDWRMGVRRKWENTAREMFPQERRISYDSFALGESGGDKQIEFLQQWRRQIDDWSGFNSKSEGWWDSFVQSALESVIPIKRGKFTDFLHTIRHKDPVAAMRSAAFHTLLGFYNPIQFFVQAQGASVAVGIIGRPDKVARILVQQIGLRSIQTLEPGTKAFNTFAKATGWKPERLAKVKRIWDRTGLFDSMFTNADVEAAIRGFPTTGSALRSVFNKGLFFYREGEGVNRRMAFLAVLDEIKDLDELLTNDQVFRKMLTRTSDIMLNLNKGNRATFQKGLASVPTQFMQVVAKTFESLIIPVRGSEVFTPYERLRVLLAQMSLYGAAGLPLGSMGLRYMLDMTGTNNLDVDDPDNVDAIKLANGGFYDLAAWSLGMDIEVGNRASLIQGFNDLVFSLATDIKAPYEYALGPFGSIPSAFFHKLSEIAPMLGSATNEILDGSLGPEETLDTIGFMVQKSGDLVGSVFSTWRNIDKARYMHNLNQALNRKGQIVSERDFKWQEEMMVLMGFRVGDAARGRDLTKLDADREEFVEHVADDMLRNFNSFMLEVEENRALGLTMSEQRAKLYSNARNSFLLGVDNAAMAEDLALAFERKLLAQGDGETKLSKAVQKALRNYSEGLAEAWVKLNNRMTPLREQLEENE